MLLMQAGVLMLALGLTGWTAPDEAVGTIIVTAEGFKNREGRAIFALYRRGENWLELDRAFRSETIVIEADAVTVRFEALPYDTYAVSVVHDKNSNDKLDMRWFPWPKPKEGAGVSNNRLGTGPPSYDKAKFDLDRPSLTVVIRLQY